MQSRFLTFQEYVAIREGILLPKRPPRKGLPRINTTPFTDAQRAKMVPKKWTIPKIYNPPKPFKIGKIN